MFKNATIVLLKLSSSQSILSSMVSFVFAAFSLLSSFIVLGTSIHGYQWSQNATTTAFPFPTDLCAIGAWPTEQPGVPYTAQLPDAEFTAILGEVDPLRIQTIIEKLVSFGTRHTLSTQADPVKGIGTARDWLLEQYKGFADESDGWMMVELQSYIQPVASRINFPTNISNIVAILRGSSDPDRIVVVRRTYIRNCLEKELS